MNATRIDKDAIIVPRLVDCHATAVPFSSVEDLRQAPFNDLLDGLFHLILLCFELNAGLASKGASRAVGLVTERSACLKALLAIAGGKSEGIPPNLRNKS